MAETIVKLLYYEKVINRTNDYYTLLQIPLFHSSFVARVVFYILKKAHESNLSIVEEMDRVSF